MATFTPPVSTNVARVEATTEGPARALFRHVQPGFARAVNVYKLTDGTYVENTPADYDLIDTWYYGGRTYTVTDAEATALELAGYTVV